MKKRTKRQIADFLWTTATFTALYFAGAGLWAALILPYGMWNFYDGFTRDTLSEDGKHG